VKTFTNVIIALALSCTSATAGQIGVINPSSGTEVVMLPSTQPTLSVSAAPSEVSMSPSMEPNVSKENVSSDVISELVLKELSSFNVSSFTKNEIIDLLALIDELKELNHMTVDQVKVLQAEESRLVRALK
jgi:hypothetical protein